MESKIDLEIDNAIKLWERLDESLKDENNLQSLKRTMANTNALIAMMESNGMLCESKQKLSTLKTMNKRISMGSHDRSVDNVLVYIFLKSLSTVPSTTSAYKLGLIDAEGRLIRNPETKEEEDSISNLDLLMFKIRKWLSSKMQYLSTVSWLRGTSNNLRVQNYFSNVDTVSRQYIVQRVNADLERILSNG